MRMDVPRNDERFSAMLTAWWISLIVGSCNLRETSSPRKNTFGIRAENSARKVSISAIAKSSFSCRLVLSTSSSTTPVASPSPHHFYHPERRKTMPSYEFAKEVYELLSAHKSTLFLTNGNVSRRSQKHRAIFRRVIASDL